jgi:hypothetical protein
MTPSSSNLTAVMAGRAGCAPSPWKGEGWGGGHLAGAFLDCSYKVSKDALEIAEDIVVPISNDGDVFLGKPLRAALVCALLLCGMLTAVSFDGEPKSRAEEIKREWPDRMLSSEL